MRLQRNGQYYKISTHAFKQFITRHNRAYPEYPLNQISAIGVLIDLFKSSNKLKKMSNFKQQRNCKYAGVSDYFRADIFSFIVQNETIVTIEIYAKNRQHLNITPEHKKTGLIKA